MEEAEHRRQDHIMVQEEKRLENARQAIENGKRARMEYMLTELRNGFRGMRKEGR